MPGNNVLYQRFPKTVNSKWSEMGKKPNILFLPDW